MVGILTLLCDLVSQERFTLIHSSGFAQSQSPRHWAALRPRRDLRFRGRQGKQVLL